VTRVLISLLKGSNNSKIALLNRGYSLRELSHLCETDELKKEFNLEKGHAFSRFSLIEKGITKGNIKITSLVDSSYPDNLKNIYDPPFLLYVRGNLDSLKKDLVSVVGTRKPSLRGLHESFKLGMDLGRSNIGVVSGLALGIDSASHKGNLVTGGESVAVFGSGVDTIYPKSNKALAGDLLQSNGAIISEFPLGESPLKFNFPKRNRVIAGLSNSLIIVQAPTKSGSLITGDFALNNGRSVYVHSVGVNDKKFLGSDKYYKDGAKKIDSALPLLIDFKRELYIPEFDSSQFSSQEIIKLELDGAIIKYKGCYFRL